MPPLPVDITSGNPDRVLSKNYGHVGLCAANLFMQKTHSEWEQVVETCVQEAGSALGLPAVQGPDRFRVALSALASIGAMIGRRAGLKLSVEAVNRAVGVACHQMRKDAESLVVHNLGALRRYILDNNYKFGRMILLPDGKFTVLTPPNIDGSFGEIKFTSTGVNNTGSLVATSVHVNEQALLDWVKKNKLDTTDFRRWLEGENGGVATPVGEYNFMSGTASGAPGTAVKIDTKLLGSATLSVVPPSVDKVAKVK